LKVTDSDGGIGVDTTRVTIRTVPAVSVVSSNSTSILGQPVTLTANVSANTSLYLPTWIWTPTPAGGNVVFTDNGTVLATLPVVTASEGIATANFTISTLSPGNHIITATYSGDAFFLPGGTGNMTQQVHYNFVGFQSPIDGSTYTLGRNIPVKFSLTDYDGMNIGTALAGIYAKA
jgi:hypothetical protein